MKLCRGVPADIDRWMALVTGVRANFPGLETPESLEDHRNTVLRFMSRGEALCMKDGDEIAGVLLFSSKHSMICCLAVAPEYRRRGAASAMLREALSKLDSSQPICVTTFREGDEKGTAPRALYRKFGFIEDELCIELGYPCQKFILNGAR